MLASACFKGPYKKSKKIYYICQCQPVWQAAVLLYYEKNLYFHLGVEFKPITSLTTFLPLSLFLFLSHFSPSTYGTRYSDTTACIWSWFFIVLQWPLATTGLAFDVEDFLSFCLIYTWSLKGSQAVLLCVETDERFGVPEVF